MGMPIRTKRTIFYFKLNVIVEIRLLAKFDYCTIIICSLYTNSRAFHKPMTTFSHQDGVTSEISKLTKYLKFIFCIRFRGLLKTPNELLYSGHLVALMFYRDSLNQCYGLCHLSNFSIKKEIFH